MNIQNFTEFLETLNNQGETILEGEMVNKALNAKLSVLYSCINNIDALQRAMGEDFSKALDEARSHVHMALDKFETIISDYRTLSGDSSQGPETAVSSNGY
ncbi:MAG: hypothetical protein QM489_01095 [Candidatus Izemoplasma sp.]